MRMGSVIVAVVASLSTIIPLTWGVDAQTSAKTTAGPDGLPGPTTAVAPSIKDKSSDLNSISKAIGDETSRLQNDAAGWDQRLQELETDIDKPQDVGTTAQQIEECLVILRAGADRLGPTSETRVALRKQEGAIRDVASRAEVHSDPGIRKTAIFFQQKVTELRALNRSIEETRILLTAEIDRLEKVKVQVEFNHGGGQIGDTVKRAQATLNRIQVIAGDAQRLANELNGFGLMPAAAANPAAAPNPAAAAKPAEATNPADARKRR